MNIPRYCKALITFLLYQSSYNILAMTSLLYQNYSVDLVCTTGDVRLVGGSNPLEGRVEVCFFNQWGTICDTMWGTEEAEVVCQQLGFAGTRKEYHMSHV